MTNTKTIAGWNKQQVYTVAPVNAKGHVVINRTAVNLNRAYGKK